MLFSLLSDNSVRRDDDVCQKGNSTMSTPRARRGWSAFVALSATVALTVTPLTAWASPGETPPQPEPQAAEVLETAQPPALTADELESGTSTALAAESTPENSETSTENTDRSAESTAASGAEKPSASETSAPEYMSVTFERTDNNGDTLKIGQKMTFAVTYTNLTKDKTFTAFPYASNLSGFLTTGRPNCRWGNLRPGQTQGCTSISYTVTAEDAETGSFTPYVEFRATADTAGKKVLQDGIRKELKPVTLINEQAPKEPDPATIPTDRKDMQTVPLARAGDKPNYCYRIPALAQANNGWILAAYDGRPDSCMDSPNPNHITLRISKDEGKSWTEPKEILKGKGHLNSPDKYGYSDPSFVVNEKTGRIFLFSVFSYDVRFQDSKPGTDPKARNVLHAQVSYSDNNGESWSEPRIITKDITFDPAISSRFAASGAGIQLKYGPHKDRLIQQFTMTVPGRGYAAVSVYSDDNGETWKPGKPVYGNMDENKVVELSDGTVMLNSRSSDGTLARKVAYSHDGGETYTPMQVEWQLPDPRNNASIIRAFPDAEEGSDQAKILLYSSSSARSRSNGLIRISYDDGKTWSVGKQFKKGAMAYSTMWALDNGKYGIFFEGDNNDMLYAHFGLDWLDSLPITSTPEPTVVNRGEATLKMRVTNKGDAEIPDPILTPGKLPRGWSAEPVQIGALAPGETRLVNIPVTIADYAPATTEAIAVNFVINAQGKVGVNAMTLTQLVNREGEVPEAQRYMSITFERTDKSGDTVRIGQELNFKVTYTNLSDRTITAFPYQSTLSKFLTTEKPNCRWGDLKAGATQGCSSLTYKVTAEDAKRGSFTPYVVFRATEDRDGTRVLQDNIRAELPAIKVLNEEVQKEPDPATIPTERKDMETIRLAKAGDKDGYCYRIPALAQAKNGWILAAYDGRPGSCADSPNPNHITLRISKDNGKSWTVPEEVLQGKGTIRDANKYGYSDPSFVVNEETGRIFLFSVFSYDVRFQDSQPGTDPDNRRVLHAQVTYSDDNGETWSKPRLITKDITFDENIRSRFAASGAGIQLKYGPHKGRLIQQFTMTMPNGKGYAAVSVYSDDNGATWTPGQPVYGNMDENKVVELSDGTVMLNSRSSDGIMARKIAFSKDGGQTYTPMQVEWQLPDPRNNASIIRAFPNAPEGSAQAKILLYSSSSATSRSNGLVRISYDDGRTWSVGKQFKQGAMSYSTMWAMDDGRYGIFYEGDNNDMLYAHFTLDWLNSLPVSAVPAEKAKVYRGKSSIPLSVTNMGSEDLAGVVATPGELPAGWEAEAVELGTLKAGETRIVQVPVTIGAKVLAGSGDQTIPFRITSGDKVAVNGFAEVTLINRECESRPVYVPGVKLANDVAAETAREDNGTDNLFDGDLTTIWHSPWSSTITLPLDIDLALPQAENIGRVDVHPRSAGGDNGRIRSAELWAGKDAASAVKIAEGTFENSPEPATFFVDTKDAQFLRLRITGTYGTRPNSLASAAEIAVYKMTEVSDTCVEPSPEPEPTPGTEDPTPGTEDPTPGTPDPSPAPQPTPDPTPAPTPTPEPTPDPSEPAIPESNGNANYLSNSWTSTVADLVFSYGRSSDEVLVGDWTGDGRKSVAVRRGNQFFVKNSLGGGNADTVFSYGKAGDKVAVGDWDGDGKTTFAVIRGNKVFVKNSLTSGNADSVIAYGKASDTLISGDWDGDGIATFAAVRGNQFFVKNSLESGNADAVFSFGRVGDEVIVGDWDGDGVDTVGVRRGNIIYTADAQGNTVMSVAYGKPGDKLIIGDWDGDGIDTPGVRR